jgi:hypothetical protein
MGHENCEMNAMTSKIFVYFFMTSASARDYASRDLFCTAVNSSNVAANF